MIVPMRKAFVVARQADRQDLLTALGSLGAVHIQPVEPAKAVAEEQTLATLDRVGRALQALGEHTPAGPAPALDLEAAVDEVLRLQREQAEAQSRLSSLYRQVEQLAMWGDVRLEQFHALARSGVNVSFFAVPAAQAPAVQGDLVQALGNLPGKRTLLAVVTRQGQGQPALPPGCEPIPLPTRDRPSLREEAARIDQAVRQRHQRLAELAALAGPLAQWQQRLQRRAEFTVAQRSGLDSPALYAVQGWLTEDKAPGLADALKAAGVDAAVQIVPPEPDDQPPTEIRLPRWAEPIRGLMQILNIHPGYREHDVAPSFMIAVPVFSAILISDAGYALMFLLPLLFYRKACAAAGRNLINLVVAIGGCTFVWGLMTGSFFGMDLARIFFGEGAKPFIVVSLEEDSRRLLMRLSFTMGVIHLVIAQLWRALVIYPDLTFLNKVGWAVVLTGMYNVVTMFVLGSPESLSAPIIWIPMAIGGFLAISFASPSRNLLKTFALGLANFPLSFIGTFSDIMSYVRLMAVGLAGSVLAVEFNKLALSAGPLLTVPVLLFGHGLNVGLSLIALFSHAVRLNVLEFSNNFGLEWSGYPYQPFRQEQLAGD